MTWVLVDVSYLAYRALRSVGFLSIEDTPVGVLFGFFQQLRTICDDPQIQSNKVALFFDSRKSFRAKAYPEYKKQRRSEKPPEEQQQISIMHDQVNILRKLILPAMGVPTYRQSGCESDDQIAYAAKLFKGSKVRKAVIITADQDLFQCIHKGCHWFDPMRNIYWKPSTFKEAKGIAPSRWGQVKTLAGCSSDNVAGVPGVGEKTAIKYLQGTLPHHHKTFQALGSKEGQAIRKRNKELVILPHYKTKPFTLQEPQYDVDAFFHYCERYALLSFLKPEKRKGWEMFFTRKRPRLRRPGERRG